MSQETIRRQRRCGPKTRTGCKTCKIRRIKCDEAKPWCQRCTGTGRKCDGYVVPGADGWIASPDDRTNAIVVQRLITRLPGNTQEKRAFQYFIKQTSPELNGFFTTGFWERLILQASQTEPSLRHAVVAIGALHEEFSQTNEGLPLGQVVGGHLPFAVKQYTKAIGHLRRSLGTGDHSPLTALMSCILFVCFDCLRGYYHTAIVHLKSGMKILQDLRAQNKAQDPTIENIIAPLLVRLSVQSILYVDTSQPEQRKEFATDRSPVIIRAEKLPEIFQSLEQARAGINECADGLFKTFYICDPNIPIAKQSVHALGLFKRSALMLAQWNDAFETFMNASSKSFSSREIRGAALLKIHHTAATIMSAVVPEMDDQRLLGQAVNCPSAFEPHLDKFRIIINLCTSLIAAAEQDSKNGKSPLTFSTDLGLIAPLYYTAMKPSCRQLRRDALELLKRCPRKEGMWDSVATVKLVTEYWQIEDLHPDRRDAMARDTAAAVRQAKLVDLVFFEGGRWEWVWPNTNKITPDTFATGAPSPLGFGERFDLEAHRDLSFDTFTPFDMQGDVGNTMEFQGSGNSDLSE